MSRHWDRLQGRLRDGVLGAREAEAQRRSWKGSLASKAAVTPQVFFVRYLHSNQGPKSPAWCVSHSGIPVFEKS